MLIEQSSDLIREHRVVTLKSGESADEVILINDQSLLISRNAMSLFRRAGDWQDPLGNGHLRSADIAAEFELSESPFVVSHKAGFAQLSNGCGLLIGLNDVRLYPDAASALRGQNEISRLALGGS